MRGFREQMNAVVQSIERIEALDGLSAPLSEKIQTLTKPDVVKNVLSGTWLGHQLHPVLTDLPIGAWMMASALDCISGPEGAREARRLVGLGVLAAVPAAATGASDWSDTYGGSQRIGLVHALSNVTAAGLQGTSWVARSRGHRHLGIGLSATGLAVVSLASYLGGHLSYAMGVGVNHTAFQPDVEQWKDVAARADLSPGEPIRVKAGGVPVMLVEYESSIYALSATCVHAGGPLDEGELLADGCIRCPWHASTFQLSDGAVVRGPASMDQPSWEVKVENERVFVRSAQAT